MSREHVDHKQLTQFASEKVNLPKSKADEYRGQARRVREKLETYLGEHPDFSLKKILLSGSLAKGTALKTLNDIDMACYVSGPDVPREVEKLIEYIAERLRKAFPNFSPDQVKPKTFCVTVSFKGTGLDVDVVPILYQDDPDWYGELLSQDDGTYLKTCIPRHLEFIRSRKEKQKDHFIQVVRLIKFWARNMKAERVGFRFKSFMIELIMAKLLDEGKDFSDYIEGMQHFFTYVATSNLEEMIAFTDYYPESSIPNHSERVRVIDPVNEDNNASKLYTSRDAEIIIEAALDAGDAIDSALSAITKQDTIYYWQKVFGPTFQL